MKPDRAACLVAMAACMLLQHPLALASQKEDFAGLEAEATRALRPESEVFAERAALVARLHAASERAPDANQRARFALLWLRAMHSLLAKMPFGPTAEEPYREWLERHENVVIYSEPAGQWLLIPEVIWKVHDAHRSAAPSEAIAWFAIENGYPGECEGYIPCYANIMNWLDGEYLRRYPRGPHASEAVNRVHESLTQSVNFLSEPDTKRYLDPSTDCGDLKRGLVPLRQAIDRSNAERRVATIALIDTLLARCR